LTESTEEYREPITRKLEELGVSTSPDQVEELGSAYRALLAWIQIADELANDEAL
jgi:hypothetical protein